MGKMYQQPRCGFMKNRFQNILDMLSQVTLNPFEIVRNIRMNSHLSTLFIYSSFLQIPTLLRLSRAFQILRSGPHNPFHSETDRDETQRTHSDWNFSCLSANRGRNNRGFRNDRFQEFPGLSVWWRPNHEISLIGKRKINSGGAGLAGGNCCGDYVRNPQPV